MISRPRNPFHSTFLLLVVALLVVGSVLLGAVASAAAQSEAEPDLAAGVADGLLLFEERCASCHGPQGLGDGAMAADLPFPPRALADPAFLSAAVPGDLFETITNGRVERGMPPFGFQSSNPLSADERWRLVAAIYSLGTTAAQLAEGERIYVTTCSECHGLDGDGDPAFSLNDPAYWLNSSNQRVAAALAPGLLPEHEQVNLSESERGLVTAYIRANFGSPVALFEPLPAASIGGQLVSGATGDPLVVAPGQTAQLRAFTEDLDLRLTLTTTVTSDGRYYFALNDVSPAWFYRVQVTYEGLDFASDFGQLSRARPQLDLPLIVYDRTTDATALQFEPIHIVIDFIDDNLQVNELYVISNNETAVYMGPTGDTTQGTVRFALPPGARELDVQRGFGSFESFFPTDEVILTDDGWATTLPVRPGRGSLTLLARYTLPYRNGLKLDQRLYHDAAGVTLVMRDSGVRVAESGGWIGQGQQTMGGEPFVTYVRSELRAGSSLDITFSGRSRMALLAQEQGPNIAIGVGFLLLALAAAVYMARSWRKPADLLPADTPADADELVEAIADLDDAYEQGEIDEAAYSRQRAELKAALREIWEEGGEG